MRTKKEILDEAGQLKKGCKIISKGDIYERQIFTTKDVKFKSEMFLEEVKESFTNLINLYVKDEKEQLKVFEKQGVYLPMKKIGKRNPKAEQIQSDNQLRQQWNQTVDRALLGGVPEVTVMKIKQVEISDIVNASVKNNGKCPQLFANVLKMAITVLQILVSKVLNAIYLQRKSEEPLAYLPDEQKNGGEIPKVPLKSELVEKYPRLETIYQKLNNQNVAIYQKEQLLLESRRELENMKGIFKGKQRKVLQGTIEDLCTQISSMKQHFSNMMQDYGYKNMKGFLTDYNAAKAGYGSYQKAVNDWKNSTTKKSEPVSILERLETSKKRIREADNNKKQVRTRSQDRDAR